MPPSVGRHAKRPIRKTREWQAPATKANASVCHTLVFANAQNKKRR